MQPKRLTAQARSDQRDVLSPVMALAMPQQWPLMGVQRRISSIQTLVAVMDAARGTRAIPYSAWCFEEACQASKR